MKGRRTMIDIINEVISLTESKLGTAMGRDQRRQVLESVAQSYGGERHYLPKMPKLVAQVRVEAIGTSMGQTDVAKAVGMSVRQVRRIVRGC
jgi:Mor family transcriptional regulator